MEFWLIWAAAGGVLILLELVLPGGIAIFVGISALAVGLMLKAGFIHGIFQSLMAWFVASIVLLLFLRTYFMKHFEGASRVQNTSEDEDAMGTIVTVLESIEPHQEGRVSFRGASWQARSEETLVQGAKAMVVGRDGNIWIVKSK